MFRKTKTKYTLNSFIEEKIYPEFERQMIMYFSENHKILNIDQLFEKNKDIAIVLKIIPDNYHKIIINSICDSLNDSFFSEIRKTIRKYHDDILKMADDFLVRFIYSKDFIYTFIPPECEFKIINCYSLKIKRVK